MRERKQIWFLFSMSSTTFEMISLAVFIECECRLLMRGEEKLNDLEKSKKKLEKRKSWKNIEKNRETLSEGWGNWKKKLEKILICCRCGVGWGHENSDFFFFFFIFLSSEERMDGEEEKKGESVRWISEKEERKEEKLGKLLTIRAKSGQFLNIISFLSSGRWDRHIHT